MKANILGAVLFTQSTITTTKCLCKIVKSTSQAKRKKEGMREKKKDRMKEGESKRKWREKEIKKRKDRREKK